MRTFLQASCVLVICGCSQGHANDFKPLSRAEPIVRAVLQEAENEPFNGMVAVAGVVLDRVADERWPNTRSTVVYQRRQFTAMGVPLRKFTAAQVIRARNAVARAETGDRPCGEVLWYHTSQVDPRWNGHSWIKERCRIGNHIFYGK